MEEKKVQNNDVKVNEAKEVNGVIGRDLDAVSVDNKVADFDGIKLIPELVIERAEFELKKQKCWAYRVVGTFNSKVVKIELSAGSFAQNGKRYTDKEIYDLLDDLFEMFTQIGFGIKTVGEDSLRRVEFYILGVGDNGVYQPVPVIISKPASRSKLSLLLSDISARLGVALPSVF